MGWRLLNELGRDATILGEAQLTGEFAHTPELIAENLSSVLIAVPEAGADIGFWPIP